MGGRPGIIKRPAVAKLIVRIDREPGPPFWDALRQDVKFGARILAKSPAISLAVVIALALGIGANTAMFSVIDAALLRPLRYHEPQRLMILWEREANGTLFPASAANFLDWRARLRGFPELAGWQAKAFVLTGVDRPERLAGAAVTANMFAMLGVQPLLGRTFAPGEDAPEADGRVAVLSYGFWKENLGGDAAVLGRMLRLNGAPYQVVGVMPRDFYLMNKGTQLWVPAKLNPANRDFRSLTVIARLGPGQDRRAAAKDFEQLALALAAEYPAANRGWSGEAQPLIDWMFGGDFRDTLLMMFAAIGLVLLLACVNIANLLLARSAARQREIAIRLSLGATRGRLLRQMITESLLLAGAGGLLGLALARPFLQGILAVVPPYLLPPEQNIAINGMVLGFTCAVSLLTGLLFGLAPAWLNSQPALATELKDSARGTTGGRARRSFQQMLVVGEVAIALMLLMGAGLLLESLAKLSALDPGVRPANALSLRLFLTPARYPDAGSIQRAVADFAERVRRLPGVEAAGATSDLPLRRLQLQVPFETEAMTPKPQPERPGAYFVNVDPGFLRAAGARLRAGRDITEQDTRSAPPVVLVNDEFARRFFPGATPVGKRLRLNRPLLGATGFEEDVLAEVVGQIANIQQSEPSQPPEPVIYAPFAQNAWSQTVYLILRSPNHAAGLAAAVRAELQAADPDQPVDRVLTLESILRDNYSASRFRTQLLGLFATVALALAVVGIYSVNAHAVAQRTHEIGVRMALGATRADVVRLTLGAGMRTAGLGLILGAAGALSLTTVLRTLLYSADALNLRLLLAVALLLALVSLGACWLPAIRAARIDPVRTLRQD
jgi:putative ABC transport system permease protein